MPIKREPVDISPVCDGHKWVIQDQAKLAGLVATLMLGEHLHARNILDQLQPATPPRRDDSIDRAIAKLTLSAGDDPWHRDGWVMQFISWIVCYKHRTRNATVRAPQSRRADKGFDGLVVEVDAKGLVIVVPSDLITFTTDKKRLTLGKEWFELRDGIFSKTDHCLTIDDPIEHLLDRLHLADEPEGRNVRYFLNRLPLDDPHSDRTSRLLNRSLGAFRAGQRGAATEFASKVKRATVLRRKQSSADPAMAWSNRLASSTGIPASLLQNISTHVGPSIPQWTVLDCLDRTLNWLFSSKALLMHMLPIDGLSEVFPKASDGDIKGLRIQFAQCCKLWVSGAPLRDIESVVVSPGKSDLGRCVRARKFARRVIVDLVYAVGLFPQVVRERAVATGPAATLPLGLLVGPSCIRHGYDRPELLALDFAMRGAFSRVEIHRIGASIDSGALAAETDFVRLQRGMKVAYEEWAAQQP